MSAADPGPAGIAALLLELWRQLSERRRRQLLLLLALMLVGALLETFSLGALLPFLGVLSAPQRALAHPLAARLAALLGLSAPEQLVLPLAAAFGAAALASAGARLLILWVNTTISYAIGGELSRDSYRRTLYQPYPAHVARNSAVVVSAIFKKTSVATSVVYQALNLASSTALAVAVAAALLLIDARIAALTGGVFGAFYLLVTRRARTALYENGRRIARQEDETVRTLQEGLGGIRDVLLDGSQGPHLRAFERVDSVMRRSQGRNQLIANFPRYVMEGVGMLLIAALACAAHARGGAAGAGDALPVLGAFALAAQRLLPALQQIYAAWAGIVGCHRQVLDVLELLRQSLPPREQRRPAPPLPFSRSARFEGVKFRYSENGPWVLRGLDLSILKGDRVGITGSTGSGKSTLVDLFLGLLDPTQGRITIDGSALSSSNLRSWQRCVAHVPQSIFLADASIAENIALGSGEEIDLARVRRAAEQARVADFIETMPEGYGGFVGERGIRLSGGQRQRVGVARALYKQASVLVLDEATSALDSETEEQVMQTIEGLDKGLTVLIVAHRLSTLRRCDRVVELGAEVVEHGSYGEFMKTRRGLGAAS